MQLKVTGVVVREMNLGESDRIVTILTKERGVVRAFARGSKRLGSRLFAATQPFCLSDFVLYHSKDKYILNEAQLATSFFKLRQDIERLSLAQYFCEVVSLIAPQEEEAEEWLRLIELNLNSVFRFTMSVLPIMRAKKSGKIVNIMVKADTNICYAECHIILDLVSAGIGCAWKRGRLNRDDDQG